MANLYFKYGTMGCGKSTALLQTAYNYESKNMKVIVMKPAIDTKSDDNILSRMGLKRKVDYLIPPKKSIKSFLNKIDKKTSCVLVDEAQFLFPNQVEEIFMFTKIKDIPVICYGLKVDFQAKFFTGNQRLFELSDEIEELYVICRCGEKATLNGRKVNGKFTASGDQVLIDDKDNVEYEALCGKCYLEKVMNIDVKKTH